MVGASLRSLPISSVRITPRGAVDLCSGWDVKCFKEAASSRMFRGSKTGPGWLGARIAR